ncbi:unnamed protein product [Absidia cylindrospora]
MHATLIIWHCSWPHELLTYKRKIPLTPQLEYDVSLANDANIFYTDQMICGKKARLVELKQGLAAYADYHRRLCSTKIADHLVTKLIIYLFILEDVNV